MLSVNLSVTATKKPTAVMESGEQWGEEEAGKGFLVLSPTQLRDKSKIQHLLCLSYLGYAHCWALSERFGGGRCVPQVPSRRLPQLTS